MPSPGSDPAESQPPSSAQTALLHSSPDRLLIWRSVDHGPQSGDTGEIWKVLRRGSPALAAHEVQLGQRLAGPGIAEYLRVDKEPTTGRPVVVVRAVQGEDLHDRVLGQGPLGLRDGALLGRALARSLQHIHSVQSADAPRGYVHNDVKPSNLVVGTAGEAVAGVLIDLEHAVPAPRIPAEPAGHPTRCTGGTPELAAPELWQGHHPDHPADIHGLGVVLHWAWTGHLPFGHAADRAGSHPLGRRRKPLRWLPAVARQLIEDCLATDPAQRPDAAAAAERLEDLVDHPDMAAGGPPDQLPERWLQRVQLPELPRDPDAGSASTDRPKDAEAALQALRRGIPRARLLRRVAPAAPEPLAWLRHGADRAAAWLERIPAAAAELLRQHRFDRGLQLLDMADEVQAATRTLPAPRASRVVAGRALLMRDTGELLTRTREAMQQGMARHRDLTRQLQEAEATFDLNAVHQVVREITGAYGGASESTAQAKDRVHRLAFYVERIARSGPACKILDAECAAAVERRNKAAAADADGTTSMPRAAVDIAPLHKLVRRCSLSSGTNTGTFRRGSERLRPLQRLLGDFMGEFPHLRQRIEAARNCLSDALMAITEAAWCDLRDAQQRLSANPVPVRLLQATLDRLDGLQMRELVVDLPDRPRGELLDAVESLRTKVDQARATRDRIASGAEQDIARGHWTTALYEMERAAQQFALEAEQGQGDGAAARKLSERLADAKRRKQELEGALRRNVELASRYAALQDNPESSTPERLEVLEQRHGVLDLLVRSIPNDRAAPYRQDLLEVQIHIATEQAGEAERDLDECSDPNAALSICQTVLNQLGAVPLPPGRRGRLQRLAEHWQRRMQIAATEVERMEGVAARSRRRRRRALAIAAGALVSFAGVLMATQENGLGRLFGGPAAAAGNEAWMAALTPELELPTGPEGVAGFSLVRSLLQLTRCEELLQEPEEQERWAAGTAPAIRGTVELLTQWASPGSPMPEAAQLESALRGLESVWSESNPRQQDGLARFARTALRTGVAILVKRGRTGAEALREVDGWSLQCAEITPAMRAALQAGDGDR